jgi:predicted ATPase
VQIAMLGPLEIRTDSGDVIEVAGARLRRLLIALAIAPRQTLPTSRLVDAVWADEPPAEPGNAIQALVSRLRRALPGIDVTNQANGYRLDISDDATDVARFERLVAIGRAQIGKAPEQVAETLRAALALWRGPALADVADAEFAQTIRARLAELRLTALHDRIDADLRSGCGDPLVAELEGLVAGNPLREPFVVLLMRALDAAGEPVRALVAYEQARAVLADELGVSPSAALAAEHVRILRAPTAGAPAAHSSRGRHAAFPAALSSGPGAVGSGAVRSGGTGSNGTGSGGNGSTPMRAGASVGAGGGLPVDSRDADAVAAAPLTNLRASLTSFVGRERDIAEVGALLDRSRLTTLIGPGGAGKTRLAAQAARAQLDAMPDGVWMVEFAAVSDPADLASTVLASLGVRDGTLVRTGTGSAGTASTSAVDSVDRLVAALSRKRALLVFDNCEHVIGDAARLAHTVLLECPAIRIVATSREPLGVTGEALWPVEPLTLPPLDSGMMPENLMQYASVRLLIARAVAVRPGFEVNERNAGAVVRICRAIDGMPLAIELAAARMRTMPAEQLAARLDDRFALLTGGSRTALPRHQTLRAVVDWSWELLDDAERAVWRRLSIFAGGATLDAAEHVCAGPDLDRSRVLDVITALVDKSLLVVRDDGPELRYQMLETIRAYGATRLAEAGEREHIRARHGAYFLDLANTAWPRLLDGSQLEWLARLNADHDNLNTAIRAAAVAGDGDTAIGLAAALGWYWWLRGHRREGVELIEAALALAPAMTADGIIEHEEVLATAYAIGALLAIEGTHQLDLAMRWFETSAKIVTGIDTPAIPFLRMVMGLRSILGMFQVGTASDGSVDDIPVDDPDPWIAATAHVMRAHVMLNFGQAHAEAEEGFAYALGIYRSIGERWGTAFSLSSLATLIGWRGDFAEAAALLDEALVCMTQLGVWEDRVVFRTQLARMLWLAGHKASAHAEIAQAIRDATRVGAPTEQGLAAIVAGDLARLDGDLSAARAHLYRGLDLNKDHTVAPQYRAIATRAVANLEAASGAPDIARRLHREAVEIAVSLYDAPVIAQVIVGLADVAAMDADPEAAAVLLGASTMIRGAPDRSDIDHDRIAERARAALGATAFDTAYRRGLTSSLQTISEMIGITIPDGVTRAA